MNGIRLKLTALTEKRDKTQRKAESQKRRAWLMRRVFLLLVLSGASFAVGWRYWHVDRGFSLVAFALLAVCLLLLPLVIASWKSPRSPLDSRRRKLESEMRDLQYEGQQYHQRYQPLELQIKAMEVHYNRMMDSWQEARLIKQRLDAFIDEAQPLRERVEALRGELATLRERRDKLLRTLEGRGQQGAFLPQMTLLLALAVASGAAAYYLNAQSQADYAALMLGVCLAAALTIPLAAVIWRRRNAGLESKLRQVEAKMRQLQTEGKQVMKRYHPMELQIKTLIAQYKRKRAGMENTPTQPDA